MLFLFKGCYNIPELFLGSQKTQKIKKFRAIFCRIFVLFALYFCSTTILAFFFRDFKVFLAYYMFLDKIKSINRRKSDEIYPFSTCIFRQNFVKRDWGYLQKITHEWLQTWWPSDHSRLNRVQLSHPSNNLYVRKLIEITSKVGQNAGIQRYNYV